MECDYGQFDDSPNEDRSVAEVSRVAESSLRPQQETIFAGRHFTVPIDIDVNIPDPFETYPATTEPDVHHLLQSCELTAFASAL